MVRIRKELLFFIAGVVFSLILYAICRPSPSPQKEVPTEKVVETLRVVHTLPAETIQIQKIIRESDTLIDTVEVVRVISWRIYEYSDSFLYAKIEADTVRKFTYSLLQKPQKHIHQAGILVNTSSIILFATPTRNFIAGVGWNFQRKTPEVGVGLIFRW